MRVTRTRANVVTVVATARELSALVSGARIALAVVTADPQAPEEARTLATLLARVIADYDTARGRGLMSVVRAEAALRAGDLRGRPPPS